MVKLNMCIWRDTHGEKAEDRKEPQGTEILWFFSFFNNAIAKKGGLIPTFLHI